MITTLNLSACQPAMRHLTLLELLLIVELPPGSGRLSQFEGASGH